MASTAIGLEEPAGDRIESWTPADGIELMRARLTGRAYARHRHDTYAICLTDRGVQTFDYRGASRTSLGGQVVVLHPDEAHDGRAGSDDGFAYRMIYAAPRRIADAASALAERPVTLPFVREAVSASPLLARAVARAFLSLPYGLEPIAADGLLADLAQGLLDADPTYRWRAGRCDARGIDRIRMLLDAERTRIVASEELEKVSGLNRFQLIRQFRRRHGTSPYRYHVMRRLDQVRRDIRAGKALADAALDAGFADQAHMARRFKDAYGLTPGQFRAVSGG